MNGPSVQHANSTTQDSIQLEMLKILQQLQQQLSMSSPPNSNSTNCRRSKKTPDDATFFRRVTNKYCWTHGGCGHESKECRAKANGHKDDATFENRQPGSNAFCPPADK